MFEMANLQEDALREYDELEQIYTETGMRSSRRVNKDYTCYRDFLDSFCLPFLGYASKWQKFWSIHPSSLQCIR